MTEIENGRNRTAYGTTNGITAHLPNQMRITLLEIINVLYYSAAGSPTTTLLRLNRHRNRTLKLLQKK